MHSVPSLQDSALEILEFNVPSYQGKTCHYFKRCDLFHSFHADVEVQFGGLVRLDHAANNYKENLNSLYRHPDLTRPDDVREVVDLYFHREGLDVQENQESNDCVSTDTEAANTVRCLQLHCPAAKASLQMAVHEALAPATATRPQEEEYQYDSDDSVLDLDEEYLGLAEWVMQWRAGPSGRLLHSSVAAIRFWLA